MIHVEVTGSHTKNSDLLIEFSGEADVNVLYAMTKLLPEDEFYAVLGKHFFASIIKSIVSI